MSVRLILVLWVAQVMGDCDRPPLLVNGFLGEEFLSSTSFPVGARVVYECYPGYVFQDGRSTITYCMENSTWTSLQATCEPRNCGNPGEIENGYSQASGTTFGNKAIYHCNEGYRQVGQSYQICTASGWAGQAPTCAEDSSPVNHLKEMIALGHQVLTKEESMIKAKYQLLESEREILRLKENLLEKAEQYVDENSHL
ncbi:complement decay-accelerating factor-like isoform X2 [Scyliorhinus canicula]|uniref:complement decay-accelerating factor-like isoform X2 n=1 Tax=Scyliorhinus canicula TaxID=7830 RepID=UPI0018F2BF39|nr:complement decay-accelerating factor-like isoform X2 [Scyliorhinus canicula]